MTRKFLYVSGCDDSTTVEVTDLTADGMEVIKEAVARINNAAANSGCKPTAEIVNEAHWAGLDYIEKENDR